MKKTRATTAAVLALATGVGASATGVEPAFAGDIPEASSTVVKTASGGQCRAAWMAASDSFSMRDGDLNDSDYCYVRYGFSSGTLNYQVSIPQDAQGTFNRYASGAPGNKTIYWKVCKERQNDPDICGTLYWSRV
jgi:hypothetical protein